VDPELAALEFEPYTLSDGEPLWRRIAAQLMAEGLGVHLPVCVCCVFLCVPEVCLRPCSVIRLSHKACAAALPAPASAAHRCVLLVSSA
jgi:hypothetical protein